jgi:uncharacterized protein YjbI with pentapeptide repeats
MSVLHFGFPQYVVRQLGFDNMSFYNLVFDNMSFYNLVFDNMSFDNLTFSAQLGFRHRNVARHGQDIRKMLFEKKLAGGVNIVYTFLHIATPAEHRQLKFKSTPGIWITSM